MQLTGTFEPDLQEMMTLCHRATATAVPAALAVAAVLRRALELYQDEPPPHALKVVAPEGWHYNRGTVLHRYHQLEQVAVVVLAEVEVEVVSVLA